MMIGKKGFVFLSVAAILLVGGAAQTQTLAYYRFEEGEVEARVPVTDDAVAPGSSPVLDSSGNGNHMKTFADFTAPTYSSSVPFSAVPQSGLPNLRSLDFTPNQDVYSQNADTANGANLNDFAFSAFTVEASFNLDSLERWNGLVVKDSNASGSLPAFVLKVRDDNDLIQVEIVDGSGTARQVSSTFAPTLGEWYSVAAVNDGSALSLYVKGPQDDTYVLQGTETVTGGALLNQPGNWAIGRGWFNGVADWTDGRIDEVRISTNALTPNQFLGTVPGPSALATALIGVVPGLCAILRRKRRAP
jgi:hypothetical protein